MVEAIRKVLIKESHNSLRSFCFSSAAFVALFFPFSDLVTTGYDPNLGGQRCWSPIRSARIVSIFVILLDAQFRDLMSSRKPATWDKNSAYLNRLSHLIWPSSSSRGCNGSGLLFLGSSTLLTGHTKSSCNQKGHFKKINPLGSSLLGQIATALGPFRSESLQHDLPRTIWMTDFVLLSTIAHLCCPTRKWLDSNWH